MNPILAHKLQQERLGLGAERTIAQLRESRPRWASIFDQLDTSADGLLQLEEVIRGFKMILGNDSNVPLRHIKTLFAEVDRDGRGGLDFRQFYELSQKESGHMMNHPNWAAEEEAAEEEEEKQRLREERRRKAEEAKKGEDIFAVLGLKSKDLEALEARKKQAISSNDSAREARVRRLSLIGDSIITGSSRSSSNAGDPLHLQSEQDSVSRSARRRASAPSALADTAHLATNVKRFSNFGLESLKRSPLSIESTGSARGSARESIASSVANAVPEEEEDEPLSPTSRIRASWERFSVSTEYGRASRNLVNTRQIHLPNHLPQIQALGKRYASCVQLRFSGDGSQLAGGFFDGGVRIYDVDKAGEVCCMNLPTFKGGAGFAALEEEKYAGFNKPMSSHGRTVLDIHETVQITSAWNPITNLRWQPGRCAKNLLATVDTQGSIALWDVPSNRQQRQPHRVAVVNTESPLSSLAFTCDAQTIVVGGEDKILKVFDIEHQMGKCSLEKKCQLGDRVQFSADRYAGHTFKIMSICAHPTNAKIMVSTGLDRRILIWDIRARSHPVGQIHGPDIAGDAVDICKDGISLLAGNHRSKNPIEIFDLRQTEDAKPVLSYDWRADEPPSEGGGRYTTCLLFTSCWDEASNKTIVAAGEKENLARVFERPDNPEEPLRIIGTVRGKDNSFWSSAVSSDARKAAFGSADGAICLVGLSSQR